MLEDSGWTARPRNPDEYFIYEHPNRADTVAVNPNWHFYRGDPIFNCLQRDLGLSEDELASLLDGG